MEDLCHAVGPVKLKIWALNHVMLGTGVGGMLARILSY